MFQYFGEKADITITRWGAMTQFCFHTPDGDISPLYHRDWEKTEDEFMNHLGGDFMSTPFGSNPSDFSSMPDGWRELEAPFDKESDWAHGYGAHHPWELEAYLENGLRVSIMYPDGQIGKVTREAVYEDGKIKIKDSFAIREDGEIPFGIHPIFKLAKEIGKTKLTLPECRGVRTYPIKLEETSIFENDRWVNPEEVPLREGGTRNITRLPLPDKTEELLLLCAVKNPELIVENQEEHYRVKLTWDSTYLKNCLLWISNRGRNYVPWNGNNICLGVEPITAAFDLGKILSKGENPLKKEGIETMIPVKKGETIVLSHQFELL